MRFPEFTEEWNYTELHELAPGISSGRDKPTNGSIALYGSTGQMGMTDKASYTNEIVLVARVGANAGTMQIVNEPCGVTDNALVVNAGLWNKYIFYYLQKCNLNRLIFGSGQPLITGGMLKKIKIRFGSEAERAKIIKFLILIDERISTQIRIINEIQSLISGITQKISKHSSIRMTMLSELLEERNEKNTALFPVHSVSVSEGVINQIDYLGRSFAAADTSHYNVAHKGDIIYTKSPTGEFPFGIVKRNAIESNVAVSPLYGVYKPISDDVAIYLHYYFCSPLNAQNYLHKLIQKGAKNTINITNQRFVQNCIPLPDKKTLEGFVKLTTTVSTKLKLEKSLLEKLQKQKRYLLTQMFV